MASLQPPGKQHYHANDGTPLVGGKLYTYAANTSFSTPKATYTNAAGSVSNTNPIILDARGEYVAYWDGAYDVALKDSLDNLIWSAEDITDIVNIAVIDYAGLSLDTILKTYSLHVVETISDLMNVDSTKYTFCYVNGYYVSGDGGGGVYWFDAGDTASADNLGSIIVADDLARWKLQTFGKPYSVLQFGAKPDGLTDATDNFNAALNSYPAGRDVTVDGAFLLAGSVVVNNGRSLKGSGTPSQVADGRYSIANHPSVLIIPSANTITLSENGSGIEGCMIIEQDLCDGYTYATPLTSVNAAAAVANFAGTAITLNASGSYDAVIKDCIILGFEYVCETPGIGNSVYADNVLFDCTEGFYVESKSIALTSTFKGCRGEPFLTAHLVDPTKDQRTGVAFYNFFGIYMFDDCQVRDKNGFLADNALVAHNTCAVKNDGTIANSFYGFEYISGGYSVSNIGCTALNCGGANIYSDMPVKDGISTGISIVGASLDNEVATQSSLGLIYIRDGGYNISGVQFGFNGIYGSVGLHADADYGTVDNCSVYGTVQPFAGNAAALLKMRVGYINYRQGTIVVQPLTWTPVLLAGATAQTITSYGHYTITNQHATLYFDILMTAAVAGTGNLTITGSPFTAANEANSMLGMGGCGYYANMTTVTGSPTFSVAKNTAIIDCWDNGAGSSTALTHSDITSTTRLVGWVTFRIAQ